VEPEDGASPVVDRNTEPWTRTRPRSRQTPARDLEDDEFESEGVGTRKLSRASLRCKLDGPHRITRGGPLAGVRGTNCAFAATIGICAPASYGSRGCGKPRSAFRIWITPKRRFRRKQKNSFDSGVQVPMNRGETDLPSLDYRTSPRES